LKQEESASFFEKKEAKKLLVLRVAATPAPKPSVSKSFLVLFFKKQPLFSTAGRLGEHGADGASR
jgi:hypothetical protein